MSAALQRAFPGLPKDRAKRLEYFQTRIAAREAADPDHAYKVLYAWSDPALVRGIRIGRFVNGRYVGLAEHHELMRRCNILRAWCAQKIGWRNELRIALFEASVHGRLARRARAEGR